MAERIIPDTSIIIDGKLSEMIESGELKDCELIIPMAVVDELQAQASRNREPGFVGLNELKKLRGICSRSGVSIRVSGERPTMEDIQLARSGRIDAIIRDVAKVEDGVLFTADYVQALVAEALGVQTRHFRSEAKLEGLAFEGFFDEDILSVHLKEGVSPMAKRGRPGEFRLVKIRDEPMAAEQLGEIVSQVTEAARISDRGLVEISRSGATVIQLGNYRIAITRPPFSDGLEMTIVRPIVKLRLEDYHLSSKLMSRLAEQAEGIVISGPPGSGKTTLAGSLADFYASAGKIVKTFESPRDLQVGPEVTQYGPLEGDFEKTSEILLLVRPDYTIYDEVRKTKDFQVFADMRLAGVGMVGVVHASNPVDAVQRFMSRVELGMVPHIVDTVIFVKAGKIRNILVLDLVVKVPSGMTEADLARPVVEVKDFETGKLEYEIYTFGEENVIMPIEKVGKATDAVKRLAGERILQLVRKFDPTADIEIKSNNKAIVRVEKDAIPRLIGKSGVVIGEIEDSLGISIDVEAKITSLGEEVDFRTSESGNSIDLVFSPDIVGKNVNVYVDEQYVFSAIAGRKGKIRVSKSSELGNKIVNAILKNQEIKVMASQ